ncbi:MAG: BamA/TamA family outer membrane protein [Flavobacteriaceae bacterium]
MKSSNNQSKLAVDLRFKSVIFDLNTNSILLKIAYRTFGYFLVGFLSFVSSCNTTKYVPAEEYLLQKNKIVIDGKKNRNNEIKDYLIQRPNSKFLGLPFSLHFYNIGNKNYEERHQKWLDNNPKTNQALRNIFSKKQTQKMGESYKSLQKWFLNGGEAPVILNDQKTKATAEKLRTYHFNRGYFDTEVKHDIDLNLKKAEVVYTIDKKRPYFIDSILVDIDSKTIDSIYQKHIANSFIKQGKIYSDLNFRKESNRLTTLFRNSGIYHFSENQIGFYEIDTTASNHKTNVVLKISDRLSEKNGTIISHPLKKQRIEKIGIFTDYSYNRKDDPFNDTIQYNGYTFFSHDKLKYRPKAILNAVFLEPNAIYKDSTRNMTRKHLKLLKNFKLVKIKYDEINEDALAATIVLTPLNKYSIGLNTEVIHSNIKRVGISGGFSFINRNTFKNAEILKISFQGSVFDLAQNIRDDSKTFNSWELSAEASLEVPRFIFPFSSSKIINKRMAPKTVFSVGSSFQKNIGLDKQKISGSIEYTWSPSKRTNHKLEFLNAEYVENLNKESYFNIYSSEYRDLKSIQSDYFPDYTLSTANALQFINENIDATFRQTDEIAYQRAKNIEKRNEILTTDFVNPYISYSFTYSNQNDYKDKQYFYFKGKISTSGNLTSAIVNTEQNGIKTLADIPIAQFTRTDLEVKKFWKLSNSSVLVFRSFIGVAIPYGNSDEIPFTNSYFIGGTSDIRAWKTYELGPGKSNTGLEFNVGSFKFISNLEYRFDIFGNIKGALFVDAGNIWDISNSELSKEDEKFKNLSSFEGSAIGTGFGIRYDFNFFILRLDLGLKTYEPYLDGNPWFQNYDIKNSVFNIGINYPF